jgi:hypothetical protein
MAKSEASSRQQINSRDNRQDEIASVFRAPVNLLAITQHRAKAI